VRVGDGGGRRRAEHQVLLGFVVTSGDWWLLFVSESGIGVLISHRGALQYHHGQPRVRPRVPSQVFPQDKCRSRLKPRPEALTRRRPRPRVPWMTSKYDHSRCKIIISITRHSRLVVRHRVVREDRRRRSLSCDSMHARTHANDDDGDDGRRTAPIQALKPCNERFDFRALAQQKNRKLIM